MKELVVLEVPIRRLYNMEKYYITTAIAYASSKPHIGNTYEIILADSIARFKRLLGYDVYFQTGTDEHGKKIEEKAKLVNKDPKSYVDDISLEIKKIWDVMNISYDNFVRTSDEMHKQKVQKIFKKLYDQGDIYKGKYEGLYCTPCESFYTETQLIGGKCPDCGRVVEKVVEEAYFLKLSKYSDKLIEHINNNPEYLQPESRKNEMVNNFLKPGVQDLCVSRTSFSWGIKVDFDPKHIVYVWLDALSNYITFLDYDIDGNAGEKFKKYWPADVHLIGKDIMRFHAIYWSVILMALGEELPKKIFGHPWLLFDNDKMSKSKGNVMYADYLAELFGVDAIRYFVLNETPYANDGNITYELVIERTNSDLANILGNLVNRTIGMANKYFNGYVPNQNALEQIDIDFINNFKGIDKIIEEKMDKLQVAAALEEIFNLLRKSNKYIDETTPWNLAKDEKFISRLETVIYNLLEAIRMAAVMLQPFIPETSEKIFEQLNTKNKSWKSLTTFNGLKSNQKLNNPEVLFARIDKDKKMEEIII
jgi:methionyl-tRNA synthetase